MVVIQKGFNLRLSNTHERDVKAQRYYHMVQVKTALKLSINGIKTERRSKREILALATLYTLIEYKPRELAQALEHMEAACAVFTFGIECVNSEADTRF